MGLENIFYVKKCLGIHGKEINIYKFRTMHVGAERREGELIVHENLDSLGKPACDPRVTLVGKLLRRYWIDELPQLINLAQGDIKLVGIRPTSARNWAMCPEEIRKKALKQKPGLMGISYAFPYTSNFSNGLLRMEEYLNQWEENPIETDRRYFSKIVSNILFGGIRSK